MRFAILVVVLGQLNAVVADDRPGPRQLRMLCYNIHHGEGTDGKIDLPRIAGVIRAARPDLVALQEVDRNARRTGRVDQMKELARLTGLHGQFGRAIPLQEGEYGLAILSRFPLTDMKVHPLPGKPKQEARIVLRATVAVGGGLPALTILNTHLQHDDGPTRERQVARIDELFGKAGGAFLLAGDLNARPGSAPVEALVKNWSFATRPGGPGLLTIPSGTPKSQIDYILYRPTGTFRVVESRVLEEKVASDHRPVLAVLEWAGR